MHAVNLISLCIGDYDKSEDLLVIFYYLILPLNIQSSTHVDLWVIQTNSAYECRYVDSCLSHLLRQDTSQGLPCSGSNSELGLRSAIDTCIRGC